jgi:hypothetical protein
MNLQTAVTHLTAQRRRLAGELQRVGDAISALRGVNGRVATAKPRRTMSAAARRRIVLAQKARWAKWRAKRKA